MISVGNIQRIQTFLPSLISVISLGYNIAFDLIFWLGGGAVSETSTWPFSGLFDSSDHTGQCRNQPATKYISIPVTFGDQEMTTGWVHGPSGLTGGQDSISYLACM